MEKDNKRMNKTEIIDYVIPEIVVSWIQGFPLKVNWGYGEIFIRPIKVKDYFRYLQALDFLKLQDWEVKNKVLRESKNKEITEILKKDFEENSFVTCVRNNVAGIRDIYDSVFKIFIYDIDCKSFYWGITQTEFDDLRKLILDFNDIRYHEKNPNPEIERYNKMKSHIATSKGGTIEFDTIFSVLMTKEGGGYLPNEINNLTIRQFFSAFKRVELGKAHDTTVLFKTVDSKDTVKIVDWDKSFRQTEDEVVYKSVEDIRKSNVFLKK